VVVGSMTGHTPGPWRYVPGDKGFVGNRDEPPEPSYPPTIWADLSDHEVRIGRIDEPVYMVDPVDEYDDGARVYGDPEANARLIAAAPELLAVTQELSTALNDRTFFEFPDTTTRLTLALRAAIAKAEGTTTP